MPIGTRFYQRKTVANEFLWAAIYPLATINHWSILMPKAEGPLGLIGVECR